MADDWLTSVCGFECFRGDYHKINQNNFDIINNEILPDSNSKTRFWYIKVPTDQTNLVRDFNRFGFFVADTNIILEFKQDIYQYKENDIHISLFKQNDLFVLKNIAETNFQFSRFHQDPFFPNDLANKIKGQWLINSANGTRKSRLYVAYLDKKPAGFLIVICSNDNHEWAAIDLLVVDKMFRGNGFAKALVDKFIKDFRKYRKLSVGTQIVNIQSLRLYQSMGFRIIDSSYVMHKHETKVM